RSDDRADDRAARRIGRSFRPAARCHREEGSMRAPLIAMCALGVVGGGAGADEGIGLSAGQKMLAPITFRQLAIFPVIQTATGVDKTQYMTLSEGLHRKLVAVNEIGQGGSVNTLLVTNKSEKPLLTLGGEVVLGGQQDRILGQDTIIPAHEEMRVQVFC